MYVALINANTNHREHRECKIDLSDLCAPCGLFFLNVAADCDNLMSACSDTDLFFYFGVSIILDPNYIKKSIITNYYLYLIFMMIGIQIF